MKQTTRRTRINFRMIAAILSALPVLSFATTQLINTCPQKFIATVTNIEDVQSGIFPKIEVSFKIIQNLKGDEVDSKKIQIVKDGPIQFKNGESYTVEARDKWLCSATLYSKN